MIATETVDPPRKRPPVKTCTGTCGRILPATLEFFGQAKARSGAVYLRAMCRDCRRLYDQARQASKDADLSPEERTSKAYRARMENLGRMREGKYRNRLPAYQLAVAIDRLIDLERRGNPYFEGDQVGSQDSNQVVVLERLFPHVSHAASQRSLSAWRRGERETVDVCEADAILVNSPWLWWDVWNADTVRRYRWSLDRGVFKPRYPGAPPYFARLGRRFLGDLGTDWVELARIETVFTQVPRTAAELRGAA
jgi:hypothetical protein